MRSFPSIAVPRVYGESTKIGAEKLKELRIEFRQTPYDIATGR